MTLSLSGPGGVLSQPVANAGNRLQAAIASIVSGTPPQDSQDVANVSIASQLQAQTSALRQVSGNLTQAFSMTQVADGGAAQIQAVLTQLQALALQAKSPTLNAQNRQEIDEQFQQLANRVDMLAKNTTFDNQPLLDGSLSGPGALSLNTLLSSEDNGESLSLTDLTSGNLFGGQSLLVGTSDAAGQAFSILDEALSQVTGARADIGSFQKAVDFAAANVDSALANQQAASSHISDIDLAGASTDASMAEIQRNATIALAAQGNKLTPALLQLVG